jgi:hypothetical protein
LNASPKDGKPDRDGEPAAVRELATEPGVR